MKKVFVLMCAALLGVAALVSCGKDDPKKDENKKDDSEVVAPIIVNVVMPSEANALPGTDVTIQGVGFMEGDVIVCKGQDGQADFTPEVKSVSNTGIVIAVPETAVGNYKVEVTRNGKTTVLEGTLVIPKVEKIDNIVLPTGVVKWGETLTITGNGIKATDKVILESENYDDVEIENAAAADKVEFVVPVTVYGENTVKIKRDGSLTVLGKVKIGAVVYTQALGGVVIYVSDEGLHGLVVHPQRVTEAVLWGPSIPADPYLAGTEDGIYKGASNTEKLVEQYNKVMEDGKYTYTAKSPAVLCSELEAGGYNDWFLPSVAEYTELYKIRMPLQEKGLFTIPFDNYWTSVEYASDWVWAMYYHNFWETDPANIVTGPAGVDQWTISTIAMRMF